MDVTISKMVLDITNKLNSYADDRREIAFSFEEGSEQRNYFMGSVSAYEQAMEIVASIAVES